MGNRREIPDSGTASCTASHGDRPDGPGRNIVSPSWSGKRFFLEFPDKSRRPGIHHLPGMEMETASRHFGNLFSNPYEYVSSPLINVPVFQDTLLPDAEGRAEFTFNPNTAA